MTVEFKIRGLEGMERELKSLGRDAEKVLRSGIRAGASEIRKEARRNLSSHRRTGDLAKSIKVSARVNRSRRSVSATIRNTRDTFYGMFLEFGTIRQSPTRWLSRAIRSKGPDAFDKAADKMRDRIRKIRAKQ